MKSFILSVLVLLKTFSLCYSQPEKIWATYYGYFSASFGTRVTASAYDKASGCLYVAGTTYDTTGIATSGSFRPQCHPAFIYNAWQSDIFLAKFDSLGNRIWATYYGSDSTLDYNPDLRLDGNGNIYLTGFTSSADGIATPGSYISANPYKKYQAFLAKFNSSGQRLWGTYTINAIATTTEVIAGPVGIAVDQNNNVYIGYSTDEHQGITTAGVHKQNMLQSDTTDAFIMKFSPNGVKLWATYYGGDRSDGIHSLTIDNDNNLLALGNTRSSNGITTTGADQEIKPASVEISVYLVKLTSSGQRLWGTYIPGNKTSTAIQILADDRDGIGNIYATGYTYSDSNLATTGAHQEFLAGNVGYPDVFLVKYNSSGQKLWATYFGGENMEFENPAHPYSTLAFDNDYNLYMVGATRSIQYIEKGCPYDATYHRGFFSKWKPDGHLIWSSYHDAPLYTVTGTGKSKFFYVGGNTPYDSLATPAAHQPLKVLNQRSGFIGKFSDADVCAPLQLSLTLQGGVLRTDTGYATYQWYLNGTLIPGADSNIFEPSDSGSYYVMVTTDCDCEYISNSVLFVPAPNAINDVSAERNAIVLFPNPAKNRLHVEVENGDAMSYTILDIAGKQIVSGTLNKSNDIDISSLDCGVYLFRLRNEKALRFVILR